MAINPFITSLSTLKTYIKQRLGEPTIRVELTDDQLTHCINETIEKFVEFADDGSNIRFQQVAVTAGTNEYILGNDVKAIINVYGTDEHNFDAVFPDRVLPDGIGRELSSGGLFSLELTRQRISLMNHFLVVQPLFDYNTTTKKLYFIEPPKRSMNYGVMYYKKIDYSDGTSNIYDHSWVKKYSTELAREQWGTILTKYEGSQLPNGLTLNAQGILQKAETQLEKLEQELYEVYSLPTDFLIG